MHFNVVSVSIADFNMKKKKRKVCLPYSGVSMPQISSQREKVPFGQQLLPKEGNTTFQQQVFLTKFYCFY